ncbi:CYTH domain-containing protein [Microvirga roseola]|uniref:hypothetical protein n=1 Tax=Microvirga roseola TaxID=2883126 RepID=UPI001E3A348C|nr:hypothetical protein [Microvirga roseola]
MSTRRQFIVPPSLARLIQREKGGAYVLEGYFPDRPQRSALVRIEETRSSLILVCHPAEAPEERADISAAQAQALLAVSAGQVEYVRVDLSIGSYEIQLQHFIRPGLLDLISVDLEEDGRAFQSLPWFGAEVTSEAAYRNRRIALNGPPAAPEVELTDEMLNSLLDLLENRKTPWAAPEGAISPEDTGIDPSAASGSEELAGSVSDDQDADGLGIEDEVIRELARSLRPHARS